MDLLIFYHGQCVPVNKNVWDQQLEKYRQKSPSTIELLKETQCQELEIDGVGLCRPAWLLSIYQENNEIVIRKFTDNRLSFLEI